MSNDLNVCSFRIVENAQATVLRNGWKKVISKGECKTRLQFIHITEDENDTVGKSVQVAIKVLSSESHVSQKTLLLQKPKLNFWEKFFWIPTKIINAKNQEQWVLVNRQSAQKRLNLSSKALETACKMNELGKGLTKEDVQRTEFLLEHGTHFHMQKAHQVMKDLNKSKDEILKDSNSMVIIKNDFFKPNEIFYQNNEFYFVKAPTDKGQRLEGAEKYVLLGKKFETREPCVVLCNHLRQESQLWHELKILQHFQGQPGFPVLYGYMEDDGSSLICNNFICEKRYAGDLRSATNLTLLQKKEIARDSLQGLVAMHEQGYMHADLKPANILWILNQGHGEGVLADFGLAELLSEKQEPVKGTRVYLAPEACFGDLDNSHEWKGSLEAYNQKKGAQMDMWAMGLILYELFKDNFLNTTFRDQLRDHNETLRRVDRICRESSRIPPKEVDNEICRLISEQWQKWAKDRNERSGEVGQVAQNPSKWFAEPDKDAESLEHLIWSMLQINPDKRITAKEALEGLQALLPPR